MANMDFKKEEVHLTDRVRQFTRPTMTLHEFYISGTKLCGLPLSLWKADDGEYAYQNLEAYKQQAHLRRECFTRTPSPR